MPQQPPFTLDRPRDVAFLAKALADENRLRILLCLGEAGMTVSRIVEAVGLSQPLVSHHLRELKRALLVRVERRGPFVHYAPAGPGVMEVLAGLDRLAGGLLAARQGIEPGGMHEPE